MLDVSAIEGFDWDEYNATKNWRKHGVSTSECEETFFAHPLLLGEDVKHSQTEPRYYLLGQTNAGRRLFIAFVIRDQRIRVISARDMSSREKKAYAQSHT